MSHALTRLSETGMPTTDLGAYTIRIAKSGDRAKELSLQAFERLETDRVHKGTIDAARATLADIDRAMPHLPALEAALVKASLPASAQCIADNVEAMLEGFGQSGKAAGGNFGMRLGMDLADAEPSAGAAQEACRRGRTELEFTPKIAQVLRMIAEEEYRIVRNLEAVRKLPEYRERLAKALARSDA